MCYICSGNKDPKANFTILTEVPKANIPVRFKNTSEFGRGMAIWDFGDSSEVLKNQMPDIEHIFLKAGNYEITLQVFHCGKSDKFSTKIKIEDHV